MTNPSGTGNTAPSLTTATVLLFLWAVLSLAVRVWVRLRKSDNWGWDDSTISLSALVILGNVIAVCYAIHCGYGNPWSSLSQGDNDSVTKSLFASQILYILSIGITRISASFFTARFLTRDRSHDRLANIFTALCAIWTFASMLVIAIRAPFLEPWLALEGSNEMFIRWLVIESIGLLTDFCAIAVSVYLVWTLQMCLRKRLIVCVIFSGRCLITPLVVLRLIYLHPSRNVGHLIQPDLRAGVVTQAVLDATFILASITCLKPFLRPFHSGYAMSSAEPSSNPMGWEKPSKSASSRRDSFYELKSSSNSKRGRPIVSVQSQSADSVWEDEHDLIQATAGQGLVLRPDPIVARTTAITGGHDTAMETREEQHGIVVSTTSVWEVKYE